MSSLRRFVVLLCLSFSFGGFLFYAGVVVPLASEVVGSTTQGFVTRKVTAVLNVSVAITLLATLGELWATRRLRGRGLNRSLGGVFTVAVLCCVTLFMLHPRLDRLLDPSELAVSDAISFYSLHRVYLWVSTVQWLCSLPLLWGVAADSRPANIMQASDTKV